MLELFFVFFVFFELHLWITFYEWLLLFYVFSRKCIPLMVIFGFESAILIIFHLLPSFIILGLFFSKVNIFCYTFLYPEKLLNFIFLMVIINALFFGPLRVFLIYCFLWITIFLCEINYSKKHNFFHFIVCLTLRRKKSN